jgi:hypothetical protein
MWMPGLKPASPFDAHITCGTKMRAQFLARSFRHFRLVATSPALTNSNIHALQRPQRARIVFLFDISSKYDMTSSFPTFSGPAAAVPWSGVLVYPARRCWHVRLQCVP